MVIKFKDPQSGECILCTNPKLPDSIYCEWCQSKLDSYDYDDSEKIEELETEKDED